MTHSEMLSNILSVTQRDYEQFSSGRHYDAGNQGRLQSDWTTANASPSQNWKAVYKTVIARSVKSFDNNPHTVAILNELLSNVIGTGIKPEPRVKNKDGKLELTINKELSEGWNRYNDQWDATGKLTHYEAQNVRFKEMFTSGTTLTNKVKAEKGSYLSIQNQILNVSRLDDSYDMGDTGYNDPEIANTLFGINLNANGKAISYWLQGLDRPISSDNMYHSYKTTMAEQYIGIPWLIAALKYLFANEKLIGDQIISSRLQSMIGLYMPDRLMQQLAGNQKNSNDEIEMLSGRIYHGRPGEKPEIIEASNSIKDVLDPLQRLLLHAITMTQGISYQAVTRDLVKTNMASGRINTNEDKKQYRRIGKQFSKEVCQRDWNEFVYRMVLEGKTSLNLATYLNDPWKYHQVQWRGPGFDMIDPHGEALAAIELNKAGLLTKEAWYGEQGLDWKDQDDQWITELKHRQDAIKEAGIILPEEKEAQDKKPEQKPEKKEDDKLEYPKY